MKNEKYICLVLDVVTLYLKVMVQIGLPFHKTKLKLTGDLTEHLDHTYIK